MRLKLEGLIVEGGESSWVCIRVLACHVRAKLRLLLWIRGAYNGIVDKVRVGRVWMEGLLRQGVEIIGLGLGEVGVVHARRASRDAMKAEGSTRGMNNPRSRPENSRIADGYGVMSS